MSESGLLFILAATLIPVHFIAYVMVVRKIETTLSERGIFLQHFVSACACSVLALTALLLSPSGDSAARAATLIAGHGIYSLTFLEFWSLSQISYSREILLQALHGTLDDRDSPLQALVDIGESKRAGRLLSLQNLGLLDYRDGQFGLTRKGRVASALLRLLQRLPNMEGVG